MISDNNKCSEESKSRRRRWKERDVLLSWDVVGEACLGFVSTLIKVLPKHPQLTGGDVIGRLV